MDKWSIGSRIVIGFVVLIGCGIIIGGLVMLVYGLFVPMIIATPFLLIGLLIIVGGSLLLWAMSKVLNGIRKDEAKEEEEAQKVSN